MQRKTKLTYIPLVVCLLFGVANFIFSACSIPAYYPGNGKGGSGGARPKKPDFELAKNPYRLKDTSLIDTNSIYVCKLPRYQPNDPDRYLFYRFFANGRVLTSNGTEALSKIDANDLVKNQIGYYRITGDEIKIEIFFPVNGINYPWYVGMLTKNKIWIYKLTYKGQNTETDGFPANLLPLKMRVSDQQKNGTKLDEEYVKTKVDLLPRVPNW